MNQLVKLEENHLESLSKYRHHYELFVKTGELIGLTQEAQNELFEIYKLYDPYYTYNNRCGACIGAFLVNVYKIVDNA